MHFKYVFEKKVVCLKGNEWNMNDADGNNIWWFWEQLYKPYKCEKKNIKWKVGREAEKTDFFVSQVQVSSITDFFSLGNSIFYFCMCKLESMLWLLK